jgi:hypothetical protein
LAAFTHTGAAVIAAQTSSAGSTYASPSAGCQSSGQDLTACGGAIWTLHFVNGASGPASGCVAQIDTSYDNSTWRQYGGQITAPIDNSAVFDAVVELSPPTMYSRVTFFGNVTQAVTVSAELQKLTGFA